MNNVPNRIIVDVDDTLLDLRRALNRNDIPTIDFDVVMSYIVEAIAHYLTTNTELYHLPRILMCNEVFGSRFITHDSHENVNDPEDIHTGLREVSSIIIKTGYALSVYLKRHGLFMDNYFDFIYDRVIEDRHVLFRRRI